MKKCNFFNFGQLSCSVYSNGTLYQVQRAGSLSKYFFRFTKDIFNTELWLKKQKVVQFENKKLVKFKSKFKKK